SFVELGEEVDPTGIMTKLVDAGFTSIKEAIKGIINYCTSKENMHDFIRLDKFLEQLDELAANPKTGFTKKDAEKIKAMKPTDQNNIWLKMHGMDTSEGINYVGKETVYALKFCVSNSCRLPYLKAMGMLIFATFGIGVVDGNVQADNGEIFDKLLGSR
ncbi:MAG: hypothetical protein RR315_03500, partial [Oscillospiraceae bacterium]